MDSEFRMTPEIAAIFRRGPRILHKNFKIDPTEFPLWNISYGNFGEDLALRGQLKGKLKSGEPGFYLDIGAFDPRYGNNSYLFYRYGWRGVCVDVNPNPAPLFAAFRPRDVFINAAVGEAGQGYLFEGDGFAGISCVTRTPEPPGDGFKPPTPVEFIPMKTILDQHVPAGTTIDFMSMDIENGELSALQSNDWSKYKPKIILIEAHKINAMNVHESPVLNYLRGLGYRVEGVMSFSALLLLD